MAIQRNVPGSAASENGQTIRETQDQAAAPNAAPNAAPAGNTNKDKAVVSLFGDTKGVATGGTFSWLNPMGAGFRPNRSRPSQIVQAVNEKFEVYMKSIDMLEMATISLDNSSNPELYYTAVVLCGRFVADGIDSVAYHAYLFASTGLPISSETRNYGSMQVEVQRMPSDAYDAEVRALVERKVRMAFSQSNIIETTGEVVPANFPHDDEEKMALLFSNGVMAIATAMTNAHAPADLNLQRAMNDATLVIKAERLSDNVEAVDLADLPVRSDVQMSIVANGKGNSGSLNTPRNAQLTVTRGFIDLIWRKPAAAQNQWGYPGAQPQRPEPLYAPCFVMTSSLPADLQTLPAQLVSILSAASLLEQGRWTFGLMPRKGVGKKKEVDLRDISAIGFDANTEGNKDGVGARIEGVHADSFTLGKLTQLLSIVSEPVPLLALDVPECGSSTWMHAVFAAAASGNAIANSEIIAAADYLTGGQLTKIYQGNQVCFEYGGRMHAGYYKDHEGRRHDLREIDYLAVLNLFGDRDMNVVRRWSESFNNDAMPLEVRLAHRKAILDQFNPEYTGWTRRIVFDTHFIQALAKAASLAGLNLKPDFPYNDQTTDVRTPAGFLPQALVLQPVNSGLFAYSTGFGGNSSGFGTGDTWNGYVSASARNYTV